MIAKKYLLFIAEDARVRSINRYSGHSSTAILCCYGSTSLWLLRVMPPGNIRRKGGGVWCVEPDRSADECFYCPIAPRPYSPMARPSRVSNAAASDFKNECYRLGKMQQRQHRFSGTIVLCIRSRARALEIRINICTHHLRFTRTGRILYSVDSSDTDRATDHHMFAACIWPS